MADLRCGNHLPLKVVYAVQMDRGALLLVETYAHFLLRRHRIRGEWFRVHADEALAAIGAASKALSDGQTKPIPWTIKGIRPRYRERTIASARERGMFFGVWLSIAIEWRVSNLGEIEAAGPAPWRIDETAIPEGCRAAVTASSRESGMDLGARIAQVADEQLWRSWTRTPSPQPPRRTSSPGPSRASPKPPRGGHRLGQGMRCSGPRSSAVGPEIIGNSGTGLAETGATARPTLPETQPGLSATDPRS